MLCCLKGMHICRVCVHSFRAENLQPSRSNQDCHANRRKLPPMEKIYWSQSMQFSAEFCYSLFVLLKMIVLERSRLSDNLGVKRRTCLCWWSESCTISNWIWWMLFFYEIQILHKYITINIEPSYLIAALYTWMWIRRTVLVSLKQRSTISITSGKNKISKPVT